MGRGRGEGKETGRETGSEGEERAERDRDRCVLGAQQTEPSQKTLRRVGRSSEF